VILSLIGLIFIGQGVVAYGVAGISVLFSLAMYFLEIFVAFLQAYIFTLLSALFIGMGLQHAHHETADTHHGK
jgi:F-type H+-transporting ATPase subunit a